MVLILPAAMKPFHHKTLVLCVCPCCVLVLYRIQKKRLEEETEDKDNVLAQLEAVHEDCNAMEDGIYR